MQSSYYKEGTTNGRSSVLSSWITQQIHHICDLREKGHMDKTPLEVCSYVYSTMMELIERGQALDLQSQDAMFIASEVARLLSIDMASYIDVPKLDSEDAWEKMLVHTSLAIRNRNRMEELDRNYSRYLKRGIRFNNNMSDHGLRYFLRVLTDLFYELKLDV